MQPVTYWTVQATCAVMMLASAGGLYHNYQKRHAARNSYAMAQLEVGKPCTRNRLFATTSRPLCPRMRAEQRPAPIAD